MRRLFFLTIFPFFLLANEATVKDVFDKVQKDTESVSKEKKPEPDNVGPEDSYDRGTPYSSMKGFLAACKEAEFDRAANYLSLSDLPYGYRRQNAPELAEMLYIVLDRSIWLDLDTLSQKPEGFIKDGLAETQERVGKVSINGKKIDIMLNRVRNNNNAFIWKISAKTVNSIPEMYAVYGYGPIGEKLANLLPRYEVLGMQLWQWLLGVLVVITAIFVAYVITQIINYFLQLSKARKSKAVQRIIARPLWLLIAAILFHSWIEIIRPPLKTQAIIQGKTVVFIAIIWLICSIVNIIRDYIANVLSKTKEASHLILNPAANIVKIFLTFIIFLVWLEHLGFEPTTLLAGLALGGLAIALAAQKSIENLIGAITLYISAPVQIGDFCRVNDTYGEIEEIGLRYTKVRTLDRTVLSISNANLVDLQVENFQRRDGYLYDETIHMSSQAKVSQIKESLADVRQLFKKESLIDDTTSRIRFIGFEKDAFKFQIFVYIYAEGYEHYLEIVEWINIHVLEIFAQKGIEHTVPHYAIKNV